MESIPDHDKWLDPPDFPTHGECDGCGSLEDYGDMTEIDGRWLCVDCEADYTDEWE